MGKVVERWNQLLSRGWWRIRGTGFALYMLVVVAPLERTLTNQTCISHDARRGMGFYDRPHQLRHADKPFVDHSGYNTKSLQAFLSATYLFGTWFLCMWRVTSHASRLPRQVGWHMAGTARCWLATTALHCASMFSDNTGFLALEMHTQ